MGVVAPGGKKKINWSVMLNSSKKCEIVKYVLETQHLTLNKLVNNLVT